MRRCVDDAFAEHVFDEETARDDDDEQIAPTPNRIGSDYTTQPTQLYPLSPLTTQQDTVTTTDRTHDEDDNDDAETEDSVSEQDNTHAAEDEEAMFGPAAVEDAHDSADDDESSDGGAEEQAQDKVQEDADEESEHEETMPPPTIVPPPTSSTSVGESRASVRRPRASVEEGTVQASKRQRTKTTPKKKTDIAVGNVLVSSTRVRMYKRTQGISKEAQLRREMKHYQKHWDKECMFMDSMSFHRMFRMVVRKECDSIGVDNDHFKISREALATVQRYVETKIQFMYETANLAAMHGKRVTVQSKDIEVVAKIRSEEELKSVRAYQTASGNLGDHL